MSDDKEFEIRNLEGRMSERMDRISTLSNQMGNYIDSEVWMEAAETARELWIQLAAQNRDENKLADLL